MFKNYKKLYDELKHDLEIKRKVSERCYTSNMEAFKRTKDKDYLKHADEYSKVVTTLDEILMNDNRRNMG